MRKSHTCFVSVSPTGGSATISGEHINKVYVISDDLAVPIYFTCDGSTPAEKLDGCYVVIGVGGTTEVEVDDVSSVTVKLMSTGTGTAAVVGVEAG